MAGAISLIKDFYASEGIPEDTYSIHQTGSNRDVFKINYFDKVANYLKKPLMTNKLRLELSKMNISLIEVHDAQRVDREYFYFQEELFYLKNLDELIFTYGEFYAVNDIYKEFKYLSHLNLSFCALRRFPKGHHHSRLRSITS